MYTRKRLCPPPRVVLFDQLTNLQKNKAGLRINLLCAFYHDEVNEKEGKEEEDSGRNY